MTVHQFNCKHEIRNDKYVKVVDDWSGEESWKWEYKTEYAFKDISVGQYKCTICGLIFNYSGGNPHHVKKIEDCENYNEHI